MVVVNYKPRSMKSHQVAIANWIILLLHQVYYSTSLQIVKMMRSEGRTYLLFSISIHVPLQGEEALLLAFSTFQTAS